MVVVVVELFVVVVRAAQHLRRVGDLGQLLEKARGDDAVVGGAREREVLEERERRGLLRLRPHQRLGRRLDGVRLQDGGARARVQRQVDEGRARVGVERGVVAVEELGERRGGVELHQRDEVGSDMGDVGGMREGCGA